MSLRLRLIVAFFLLSVVPLGAVTLFTYVTSAKAMREAASHETVLLAEELVQRMQLVTAQLSQRVEYLMDLAALADPEATPVASTPVPANVSPSGTGDAPHITTDTLGQLAMILNNVEIVQPRRGGAGRGARGGVPASGRAAGQGVAPPPAGDDDGRGEGRGGRSRRGQDGPVGQDASLAGRSGDARGGAPPAGPPPVAPAGGPASAPSTPNETPDLNAPIRIDLRPIRQEIMGQFATQEEWGRLSPEQQREILDKVNQEMAGIERGIRLGTSEVQRRIVEAQKLAEVKARESAKTAGTSAPTASAAVQPAPTRRRTQLQGSQLAVTYERDGEVLLEGKGDVDLKNLLSTVFSTTRRDRGEVPFAVAANGQIYTPIDADRKTLESIGTDAIEASSPAGTTVLPTWVVVTSNDPAGSGLKFGIARPVGDSLDDLWRATARNVALGLGLIGLALIGILPLSSRLTRNLSVLSDGVDRIARGDYRARVKVKAHDEVGRLAEAFNRMAAEVEQHQRSAVDRERIKSELELGRQIQADMLPQSPLHLGLTEICGVSVPAREVGGDFFNYFQLKNGDIALLVGDVSGKGVGAALLMANIQASLRTRLALGQDLAALARELDLDIESSTPGPVYATLFVGLLNPVTREFRFVNAGHNPQIILRRNGGMEEMPSSGVPIGLLAGRGYTEQRAHLETGDLLFFYTDGCVDAGNAKGDMYGAERLAKVLATGAGKTAVDLLAAVEQSVASFRGSQEPHDDATMMAVRVG